MGFQDKVRAAVANTLAEALVKTSKALETPDQEMMVVPLPVLESPRTLLHLLYQNQDTDVVPERLREILATWLVQFDGALHQYLTHEYGDDAVKNAEPITRRVLLAQAEYLKRIDVKSHKSDEVSDLEKHFGMDSPATDE